MNYRIPYVLLVVFALSGLAFANPELSSLAEKAVTGDSRESAAAIRILRSNKQAGLDAVFETYRPEIDLFRTNGKRSASWNRISSVLDRVAMQKDAYSSRLFWHTDFAEAKKEANISKKKIISLRLLGNLNDE